MTEVFEDLSVILVPFDHGNKDVVVIGMTSTPRKIIEKIGAYFLDGCDQCIIIMRNCPVQI